MKFGFIGILKTIYFNFRYLDFKDAIHFPVYIGAKVYVRNCRKGFLTFRGGKKRDASIWIYGFRIYI